jgi:hypothetical protein
VALGHQGHLMAIIPVNTLISEACNYMRHSEDKMTGKCQ